MSDQVDTASFPQKAFEITDALRELSRVQADMSDAQYRVGNQFVGRQLDKHAELIAELAERVDALVFARINSDLAFSQRMTSSLLDGILKGAITKP